jgi:hypothetical protein
MRYAGYLTLAWLIGLAGIVFVSIFAHLVVHLAEWGLSFTAPADRLETLFRTDSIPLESAAGKAHAFWLSVVRILAHGWIYSYFWTAASLIYLTMRQDVDRTDWRQVALPPAPPNPLLPEVDVAGPPVEAGAGAME